MKDGQMQVSSDNPGWQGKGIPSLAGVGKKLLKGIALIPRDVKQAKHSVSATLADLWNFHLYNKGNVCCPCCGWKGSSFVATANWRAVAYQSKCPQCDARSRHRGQVLYLKRHQNELAGRKALIFAPEKIILDALKQVNVTQIVTTDYNSRDVDLPNEDIQKMSLASETFELIICNHVLEHIPDDQSAIAESARLLASGGIALFTIPGDFDKEATWTFERLDSNGHYRHYGMDVMRKFERAFSSVEALEMYTLASDCEMIRKNEILFVCRKD
jgi:predicted SAM-dependent methyltransferase